LACWESVLRPEARWEAYRIEDEELYYGRVQSQDSEEQVEWRYFTADELRQVKAYRVDNDQDRLFPGPGSRLSYEEIAENLLSEARDG